MTEKEFQEMNDFEEDLESAMNTVTKIVAVFIALSSPSSKSFIS